MGYAFFFGGLLFTVISFVIEFTTDTPDFGIWIFRIIGSIHMLVGLSLIIKNIKFKSVAKVGKLSRAVYVDSATNTTINGVDYYFIKLKYKNEHGEGVIAKTQSKYLKEETIYFSMLKDFEIKYKDKRAIITEEINEDKFLNLAENNFLYFTDETNNINENKTEHFACSYCGSIHDKIGKCKYCNAVVTNSDKVKN